MLRTRRHLASSVSTSLLSRRSVFGNQLMSLDHRCRAARVALSPQKRPPPPVAQRFVLAIWQWHQTALDVSGYRCWHGVYKFAFQSMEFGNGMNIAGQIRLHLGLAGAKSS